MSPPRAPVADDDRQTARKRRAILTAATEVFLRNGYLGTNMDQIASAAAVSKQTIYKNFTDKERLFVGIVRATVDEVSDPVHAEVIGLTESGDVEADLRELARRQLAMVMQPKLLRLRRLVIAEAGRFPHLGAAFYERGPGRTINALAAVFKRWAARGHLRLADPVLAATQFNWLVMSAPLNEAMLLGRDEPLSPSDLAGHAEAAVRTFLAAYGVPPATAKRSAK